MHINNMPNENCEGCCYWQGALQFCNYPFSKESYKYGLDIGTHECTAYGNRYYKQRKEDD